MDDEFPFAAMHPTAGYLFAEELDIHFLALDDFRSTILLDDNNFIQPSSLSSPSSVVYLPPCYPSSPYKFVTPKDCNVFIKPEPIDHPMAKLEPLPIPVRVIRDDTAEKERLRCRQRGYEKRYRGRKRRDLKLQRDTWLALEIELDATRKKYCRPYVRVEHGEGRDTLRYKLLLLKLEERALQQDHVALRSLQAWESISRIREYSDKDELRTVSEWRHSADKVIGRCSALGPQRFHPYAPLEQRHFTW